MTATPPNRADHAPSPNAERLRQAMGWEKLPEMTPEQRVKFDEDNRRAEEEADRFYGQSAA
jgi:hypothetical protein